MKFQSLIHCSTAKVDQKKFDVMELHARPELAAQERMVDDATGEVQVSDLEGGPGYPALLKCRTHFLLPSPPMTFTS